MGDTTPTSRPALAWGVSTHPGRVREANEDSYVAEPMVLGIADGMGGHQAGEVASQLAVDILRERLSGGAANLDVVVAAVVEANVSIFQSAHANANQRGMGTTLTAIALLREEYDDDLYGADARELVLVNVGDSRAYVHRGGLLRRASIDHSYVQELVATGHITETEARTHPRRNIVTRALGIEPNVRVDTWRLPLVRGDRYVLCSDGLVDEVDDTEIEALIERFDDPQEAADELVSLAIQHGGRDNITVIVVDVLVGAAPQPGASAAPAARPTGALDAASERRTVVDDGKRSPDAVDVVPIGATGTGPDGAGPGAGATHGGRDSAGGGDADDAVVEAGDGKVASAGVGPGRSGAGAGSGGSIDAGSGGSGDGGAGDFAAVAGGAGPGGAGPGGAGAGPDGAGPGGAAGAGPDGAGVANPTGTGVTNPTGTGVANPTGAGVANPTGAGVTNPTGAANAGLGPRAGAGTRGDEAFAAFGGTTTTAPGADDTLPPRRRRMTLGMFLFILALAAIVTVTVTLIAVAVHNSDDNGPATTVPAPSSTLSTITSTTATTSTTTATTATTATTLPTTTATFASPATTIVGTPNGLAASGLAGAPTAAERPATSTSTSASASASAG